MNSKQKTWLIVGGTALAAGVTYLVVRSRNKATATAAIATVPTVSKSSDLKTLTTASRMYSSDITAIYEQPNTDSTKQAYIPKGAEVEVLAANSLVAGFLPVKYNGYRGFVVASALQSDKPQTGLVSTAKNTVVNTGNKVSSWLTKLIS